ncbi:MAG: lysophospholipid transporter LplT [Pseudomonadota bacterium]
MDPQAGRRRAFAAVLVSQFFGAVADNALLLVAIGLLMERNAAAWTVPALRLFFYLSYVLLGPFSGAVADAWPKGRVLLVTSLVKLGGCLLLLCHVHPLLAFMLVGLGAVVHAPARYGILAELVPASRLVAANAWLEGTTVAAILLGVLAGSLLLAPVHGMLQWGTGVASSATVPVALVYLVSVVFAAGIPRVPAASAVAHRAALRHPAVLLRDFRRALALLWRDPAGQLSLATTSLFWAASATLQFVVLRWAGMALALPLAQASLLQGVAGIGMLAGAGFAARRIPLERALSVLPLGIALGAAVALVAGVTQVAAAIALLLAIGALAGALLVPMNALLQQRGQTLMHTGQSVGVQHFGENLASLALLGVYGLLLAAHAPLLPTVVGLGFFLATATGLILWRHRSRTGTPVAGGLRS